uniref:Uncharacterized protein n=1 Tax=Ditylenchus dipsaci TaxID=166011 RepID=A0A915CMK0_9BILA
MSFAQPASSTNKLLIHLLILDENQENEVQCSKSHSKHYLDKAIAAFGKPVELVKARYLNSFWNEQVYANVQEEPVVLGGENGAQYFATYKTLPQAHRQIIPPALHLPPLLLSAAQRALAALPSNLAILKSCCRSLKTPASQLQYRQNLNSQKTRSIHSKSPIVSTKPEISTLKSSISKNIVIYLVIDVAQYAGRHFSSMYRYEQSFLFDIEAEKFEKLENFAKKAVKIWGQKEYDRLDLVSCSKFDAFYKEYLHVEKMLDVKVQNGAKYMINYLLA